MEIGSQILRIWTQSMNWWLTAFLLLSWLNCEQFKRSAKSILQFCFSKSCQILQYYYLPRLFVCSWYISLTTREHRWRMFKREEESLHPQVVMWHHSSRLQGDDTFHELWVTWDLPFTRVIHCKITQDTIRVHEFSPTWFTPYLPYYRLH